MNVDYIDDNNTFQTITGVTSFVPVKNGASFLVKTATSETLIRQNNLVEVRP